MAQRPITISAHPTTALNKCQASRPRGHFKPETSGYVEAVLDLGFTHVSETSHSLGSCWWQSRDDLAFCFRLFEFYVPSCLLWWQKEWKAEANDHSRTGLTRVSSVDFLLLCFLVGQLRSPFISWSTVSFGSGACDWAEALNETGFNPNHNSFWILTKNQNSLVG